MAGLLTILIASVSFALIVSLVLNLLLGFAVLLGVGRRPMTIRQLPLSPERVPIPATSHLIEAPPEDIMRGRRYQAATTYDLTRPVTWAHSNQIGLTRPLSSIEAHIYDATRPLSVSNLEPDKTYQPDSYTRPTAEPNLVDLPVSKILFPDEPPTEQWPSPSESNSPLSEADDPFLNFRQGSS
jgi:hypothetical protein